MASKPRRKPGFWGQRLAGVPKWDGEEPNRRNLLEAVKEDIKAPTNEHDDIAAKADIPMLLAGIEQRLKHILLAKKRAVKSNPASSAALVREHIAARLIAQKVKEWKSEFDLIEDAYKELLIAQLEIDGSSSVRLDNGQRATKTSQPHPVIKDRETYRLWCLKHIEIDEDGNKHEVSLEKDMHLGWSKTRELTTAMFEANQPLPPGVDVYHEIRILVDTAGATIE